MLYLYNSSPMAVIENSKFSNQRCTPRVFPSIDYAGTITDGHIDYYEDNGEVCEYEWTNDLNGMSEENRKKSPSYKKDGKWYCYTWNLLENLGAVLNAVNLTINGGTVGTEGNASTGNVFGGGDESAVTGNTSVILEGNANVLGNVYGGGNEGPVGGNSEVIIQDD